MALLADRVAVEHPTVAALPWRFGRRLVADQPVSYRTSATNLLGPGRDLLIVVARSK